MCACVTELARLLKTEGFLWCQKTKVSQQALSQRFLTFPAILFERIFKEILPHLKLRWEARQNRLLPETVQFTLSRFEKIWIADGSTLEALFRKLKSLEDVKPGKLAGKIGVVIDLVRRLPVEIWFNENPSASDTRNEEKLLELVSAKTLLLLDRGFYHFQFWQQLIDQGIDFITRIKLNAAIEYQLEMIYRGLYYFHSASIRGEASDPVKYFANSEIQKCLGIVKRQRKPKQKLIIAPFPEKKRGSDQFFFQFSPKRHLTTCLHA